MKMMICKFNEGDPTQHFGLMLVEEGEVTYVTPQKWRTEKGAIKWAEKHGIEIDKD